MVKSVSSGTCLQAKSPFELRGGVSEGTAFSNFVKIGELVPCSDLRGRFTSWPSFFLPAKLAGANYPSGTGCFNLPRFFFP